LPLGADQRAENEGGEQADGGVDEGGWVEGRDEAHGNLRERKQAARRAPLGATHVVVVSRGPRRCGAGAGNQ
jgi:hypothetical protein